ncbi:MAG: L-threonylcarbamoyladenylate synthase [Nitrospinota bacterium]|nr:L-threonylcarbamoyladenylate synthase [Nitrospinota bacterium]MDH5679009.1 L-threonylcarbamoyladenylate synthase [Nitrospinota bacterium]MDH5756432.1 L-threonylcarbamoyladenylate synthase [Nitrospinota bacterium]
METIHVDPDRISYKPLTPAVDSLKRGGIIVYPTDTVYGIGCDIFMSDAIRRIAEIKKRDANKPFSFICMSVAQISEFAFVPNWAFRLMSKVLPGPYTFILEARKTNIPKKMLGKRNTVGVRIPDDRVCQLLVEQLGRPILTSSVNLAGGEPLTDPAMLPEEFSSRIEMAISVGPLLGDPSTVVDATGGVPEVIRLGKGPVVW